MEVIYCAAGNKAFCNIAIEQGFRYGAQLPNTIYADPYFVDQDWKAPDRKKYMACLKEYRPNVATVLDLERTDQLTEVLDWAHEAAEYATKIIIIPKAHGIIASIPETISGKQVVLGYSVPTRFGGTELMISEFGSRPVHLLGGSPKKQYELSKYLNVVSLDGNMFQKMATGRAIKFWDWSKGWVFLEEYMGYKVEHNAPYHAFEISAKNIISFWKGQEMIFESLHEASQKGELLLVEGGFCHWHLRRDKQLSILEIISTKPGAGSRMLNQLKQVDGATSLFAKCPADLPANMWYEKRGFICEGVETTKTGRELKLWRLKLC